jgi:hypothetical protein
MDKKRFRRRRSTFLGAALIAFLGWFVYLVGFDLPAKSATDGEKNLTTVEEYSADTETDPTTSTSSAASGSSELATAALAKLKVAASSSHDGYSRAQFLASGDWNKWKKCDTREKILGRDLDEIKYGSDGCTVESGILNDPYTGKTIDFTRGTSTSSKVQIDHVVAISAAWTTGASAWTFERRNELANDDLELLAVDGPANQQKSDGDASEWLPPNKSFRCEYVARQIAVKLKYALWVTPAEKDSMTTVLAGCPNEALPSAN